MTFLYSTIIIDRKVMNKDKIQVNIGHRIRELRTKKSLSIQQLADAVDIEYNNLIRIEMGRTNPTIWTLYRISKALDINLSSLIEGVDND
jgi:transcriptional regulator with XRE-family HTH domain